VIPVIRIKKVALPYLDRLVKFLDMLDRSGTKLVTSIEFVQMGAHMEKTLMVMQESVNALRDDDLPEPKWDTEAMQVEFEVIGFIAPYVVVRRRRDGTIGTLLFRHSPRVYFCFEPDAD
jgi:hypothetical protein